MFDTSISHDFATIRLLVSSYSDGRWTSHLFASGLYTVFLCGDRLVPFTTTSMILSVRSI
jgi:hypothetical protein